MAAHEALDSFIENLESTSIYQSLANTVLFGSNPKIKPIVMEKIIRMNLLMFYIATVDGLFMEKKNIVLKTLLPMSIKLLNDNSKEIKDCNSKLMNTLYQALGDSFYEHVGKQPNDILSKIKKILL